MKKILIVFSLFIFWLTPTSDAHPPRNITLNYNDSDKILVIDIKHLSRDHARHYIKKIEVSLNGNDPQIIFNRQQVRPNNFTKEIPYQATSSDIIAVKAYCSKGGKFEESLTVTDEMIAAQQPTE